MTNDQMKFSLRLNNDLPVRDYVTLAQAAEAVGFDQFWVSNDLFLRSDLVILSAVAQATQNTLSSANDVHTASSEMARMAAELQQMVDRFRYEAGASHLSTRRTGMRGTI